MHAKLILYRLERTNYRITSFKDIRK